MLSADLIASCSMLFILCTLINPTTSNRTESRMYWEDGTYVLFQVSTKVRMNFMISLLIGQTQFCIVSQWRGRKYGYYFRYFSGTSKGVTLGQNTVETNAQPKHIHESNMRTNK